MFELETISGNERMAILISYNILPTYIYLHAIRLVSREEIVKVVDGGELNTFRKYSSAFR